LYEEGLFVLEGATARAARAASVDDVDDPVIFLKKLNPPLFSLFFFLLFLPFPLSLSGCGASASSLTTVNRRTGLCASDSEGEAFGDDDPSFDEEGGGGGGGRELGSSKVGEGEEGGGRGEE